MSVCQALIYFILILTSVYAFIIGIDGPLLHQEALEDDNTTLHCDTTSAISEDELSLLVWYKGDDSIYSYDARSNNEWSSQTFNTSGRLSININKRPTPLYIRSLRADDEALYHCRVEFLHTPTRYTGVNLTVIVLPSKPFFLDEMGNKIEDKIGPFFVGDTLVINCLVIGGRPPPHISWYNGEVLVDATGSESDIPNVRQNELYLPITRNTNRITCKATNTLLSAPISSYIDIEIYLSASNVSIHWLQDIESNTLKAGNNYVVKCIAYEVNPSPDIAWWLNRKHLTQYSNQTWNHMTKTAESHLQLKPTIKDDRATLAGVTTNPAIPPGKNSKADVITLNVTYVPIVEVLTVETSKLNGVIENDTFRLICEVDANPRANRFMWYYNNTNIHENVGWQDYIFGNILIFKKTFRRHTGQYSCSAKNSMGEGKAEGVDITVFYPPECTNNGVSLINEIITCQVRSVPDPNSFTWYIRTDSQFENLTTQSPSISLNIITISLTKTANITCEANNGVAKQQNLCTKVISFKHLRPQAPRQCDLSYERNQFQIHCNPVENATHYEITVWRMSTSNASLILNHKSAMGFGAQALIRNADEGWRVGGQLGTLNEGDEAGTAACNRYGCSEILLLRPTEKLLNAAKLPWWYFFLDKDVGMIVGGVLLVVVFVISTAIAVCAARRSRVKQPAPVIQVVGIDDFTREFLNSTRDLKARSSCSLRSRNSNYFETEEVGLTQWRHLPLIHDPPPPDVTLTRHRESAV
ncbi:Cell adhesion molecule 4 [Papilio xuthus]|uniref:Cell adhesion molecule 4 n=1 Tax=Papilio xuthus TaxID=66420 RepID=A0A194QDA9_PAPXU|nr:Cell adhesion molecule 4 [Papilio xuthus]